MIISLAVIICVILFFTIRAIMWYADKYRDKDDTVMTVYTEALILKCETCKHAKTKILRFDFGGQTFTTEIKEGCKLRIKPEYKCKKYEEREDKK